MTLNTIRVLAVAFAAALASTTSSAAIECPAGFPSKPITMVVSYGAGGGTDTIARALAAAVEQQQGWTIVVENRPGAGGGAAAAWLKSQTADGYIVGVTGTDAIAINPAVSDVGYTWEDFEYLGSGMQTWVGLAAVADAPFDDLAGLVKFAREKGRATISVAGVNQEILIKQIAEEFDAELVAIPGSGAAEALASALGGHVDATTQGTLHVEQIEAGKMKLIASIIDRRVPYAPNVGTLAEQGSKAQPLNSHTIFITPKGLPDDIGTCLSQAIDEGVKAESYVAQMTAFKNEALNLGREGNAKLTQEVAEFYRQMLKP